MAPAVRAALGEEFGLPVGTPVTGKMATALHEIGFDDVFDTLFSADLTILEEGTELLGRLNAALKGDESQKEKAVLPMITSCSPGWIKHIEHQFPEELDHLSTCKSPHTMLGAVVKSFYAERTQPRRKTCLWYLSCPVQPRSTKYSARKWKWTATAMWTPY